MAEKSSARLRNLQLKLFSPLKNHAYGGGFMKRSGIVSAVLAGVFVLGISGCDDSPSGNGFSGSKI